MNKFSKFAMVLAVVMCFSQLAAGAVYTVTKTADTNDGVCDSDCSLREAIAAANATADNDFVIFSSLFNTPQTITLASGELVAANNGSLTVFGPGADKLTISGNNASRIFSSGANVVVTLSNIRFTAGNGAGALNTGRGGAIYNVGGTMTVNNSVITGNTANTGGALNNAASTGPAVNANLTINNCHVFNNSSTSSGGALQNFSTSTVTIINSTFNNNTSGGSTGGGAFQANGTISIANSTFANNTAPGGSGGAITFNGTAINFNNVTMIGNTATNNGGGFHRTGANPVTFRNTIISGNNGTAASPDITGAITSNGNNIIGNVGTSSGWVMSDLQNTNPDVTPLGFYGGTGLSFAPYAGSPALNGGQNCVTDLTCAANNPPVALNKDQRGAARPDGANVDIGAYEDSESYRAILPYGQTGQPYSFTLAANIGSTTYQITGGALPGNLTLTNALIAGTPNAGGLSNVRITTSGGATGTSTNYRLYVLPATISVGGRIITPSGTPIGRTYVSLISNDGSVRTAQANSFGYYQFDEVNVGEVYQITVNSKVYTFTNPTQFVLANDAVGNADFTVAP